MANGYDEVAYQTARNDRESDLIENYNKRGTTDNYPQYGRNFWGSSPANNYGFGSSNITDNIETVKNRFNRSGAENGYNQFFNYNNADSYRRYQDVDESEIDNEDANDYINTATQNKDYTLGRIGTIDRGLTFGLGRKAGGLMNAIGSYPVDRAAEAMGYKNTPSFGDRYHEIVDPTMEAINEYHEDKPVEAAGLELGAGVFNPANKVGVGFIKNGTSFANTTLRSGVVGSGIGGVAGAMNAERVEDVVPNAFGGSLGGAAIGGALPLATGIAGKMTRPLFTTKKAPITIPTKEELEAYPAESTFNPNHYTKEQAEQVLNDRAEKSGVELGGDINHYTKRKDRKNIAFGTYCVPFLFLRQKFMPVLTSLSEESSHLAEGSESLICSDGIAYKTHIRIVGVEEHVVRRQYHIYGIALQCL